MALSKFSGDEAYKMLIRDMKLVPLSYEDVAKDWEENQNQWFHVLIAIEDLPTVLAIPNLNIYAWCRCKVVANDNSEGHFHWHGLVHFKKGTRESWRHKASRAGIRFTSSKNTFKKIKCLDHVVGVLRYIGCEDGQRVGRRDADGLRTHPHTAGFSLLGGDGGDPPPVTEIWENPPPVNLNPPAGGSPPTKFSVSPPTKILSPPH